MCKICEHADRAEIENAILALTSEAPPNDLNSVEKIAESFNVDLEELKAHALFHTPLVSDADVSRLQSSRVSGPESEAEGAGPRDSLTRQMKLREADMLNAVGNEYLVTLKAMGRRINKLVAVRSIDIEDEEQTIKCAKLLTKPMVDMYIGLGGEIRQTVKTMAELNQMLHGPEDNLGSGLRALADAIRRSDDVDG